MRPILEYDQHTEMYATDIQICMRSTRKCMRPTRMYMRPMHGRLHTVMAYSIREPDQLRSLGNARTLELWRKINISWKPSLEEISLSISVLFWGYYSCAFFDCLSFIFKHSQYTFIFAPTCPNLYLSFISLILMLVIPPAALWHLPVTINIYRINLELLPCQE
jgi:hypothetical protein